MGIAFDATNKEKMGPSPPFQIVFTMSPPPTTATNKMEVVTKCISIVFNMDNH